MFCDSPFCDDSISSFLYDLWNGEIFFFSGDVRTVESFIVHAKQEDSRDFLVSQIISFSSSIKSDSLHSVGVHQDELILGIR